MAATASPRCCLQTAFWPLAEARVVPAGRHFTASHWGVYKVENDGGNRPRLKPFGGDLDPSPIGLDQLDDNVTRLRYAVLQSGGHGWTAVPAPRRICADVRLSLRSNGTRRSI